MDGTQPKKTSEKRIDRVSTVAESPENLPHDEEDQLASKGDESPTVTVLDDTMEKSCEGDVEVVESSDSELDYKVLDDVGGDIKLANCSDSVGGSKQNEAIVVDESTNSNEYVEIKAREAFSMVRIHKEQSDDPGKWQISYRDRAMYLNMDVNKGPRCNRCRHFGHTAVRCLEKPEPPKCFLCGRPDHQEPRCPNRRCTQCGNKGDFSTTYCWKCFKFRHSVCRLCKMKGHVENTCPDLWRRYHLTTDDGPIVVSREQIKPRDEQWCSGCARQGHLEHECKSYPREYPPTTPYIVNYEDNLCLSESRLARYLVSSTITSEGQTSNEVVGQGSESLAGPLVLPNETQIPNVFVNPPLPALLPLPMISQVSAVNQFLTPNHLQYLSQLPVLTQLQSLAAIQNQMMVPNPASANYAAETANRVLNPCSVPASSGISSPIHFDNRFYLKNADKIDVMDPNRVKHLILTMPFAVVNDFLVKEMEELERCDVQPRLLKSKLFKCDKPGQPRKPMPASWQREKLFWFRLINMFIFGKHRLGDGRLHVNYLKKYLANPKPDQLNEHKRRSLLSSYSYIFTYDKHRNVNYYKWINNLIQKYDRGEAEKYIM
ncbi:hypothetical protein JTB14_012078 [Gonioctena quinquepunctata]|nr:hypothetical protein JTB14_012078 [Gonioctena quinquepunctata]